MLQYKLQIKRNNKLQIMHYKYRNELLFTRLGGS